VDVFPAGAKTSYGNADPTETPSDRIVACPSMPPKGTRDAATELCRSVATSRANAHGRKAARSGGRWPAINAREERQSPRQSWPVNPFDPVRKSFSGIDGSHGTATPRGQTPGAAAQCPLARRRIRRAPRSMKLAADHGRNGRWVRGADEKRRRHPRAWSKTAKDVSESQERCRRPRIGPRPGRENGPMRARYAGPEECSRE